MAETLITLAVIGVVAALTIPTLMRNYENLVLQSQLKKSYAHLSNVIDLMNSDYGGLNEYGFKGLKCTPNLHETLKNYLEVRQNRGRTVGVYKNYTNTTLYNAGDNSLSYTGAYDLANGTTLYNSTTCDNNSVIVLQIDVNGFHKGPNRAGYDLFAFYVNSNNKLTPFDDKKINVPSGYTTHYYFWSGRPCDKTSTSSNNGMGCAAYALRDPNYFKNLSR